jgi:hypothetical protein
VLGPTLTFNTPAITTTGSGQPVRFATLSGKGTVPGKTIEFYSASFGTALKDANNTPLDLQARNFIIETLATSLPGELPEISFGSTAYGPASEMNLRAALQLFLKASLVDNGAPRGETATFIRELRQMYCLDVGTTGGGQPIYSSQMDQQKLEEIHRDFTQSLVNYHANGAQPVFNPALFETYLETSKLPSDVRTYMRLKTLKTVTQIVSDSDLTPDQQDQVVDAVLLPARPNSLSVGDLRDIVMAIGRPTETENRPFEY